MHFDLFGINCVFPLLQTENRPRTIVLVKTRYFYNYYRILNNNKLHTYGNGILYFTI